MRACFFFSLSRAAAVLSANQENLDSFYMCTSCFLGVVKRTHTRELALENVNILGLLPNPNCDVFFVEWTLGPKMSHAAAIAVACIFMDLPIISLRNIMIAYVCYCVHKELHSAVDKIRQWIRAQTAVETPRREYPYDTLPRYPKCPWVPAKEKVDSL